VQMLLTDVGWKKAVVLGKGRRGKVGGDREQPTALAWFSCCALMTSMCVWLGNLCERRGCGQVA
jgi:hypothetical protein